MTPRDLNPHQTCLMFIITELGVSYHTKCYFFQILSKDVQQFSSFMLDSLLLVGNCSTTGVFSTISGSSQKAIICSMSLKFSFLPFTMLGEFQSTMVQQPKSSFLYSCNCSILTQLIFYSFRFGRGSCLLLLQLYGGQLQILSGQVQLLVDIFLPVQQQLSVCQNQLLAVILTLLLYSPMPTISPSLALSASISTSSATSGSTTSMSIIWRTRDSTSSTSISSSSRFKSIQGCSE